MIEQREELMEKVKSIDFNQTLLKFPGSGLTQRWWRRDISLFKSLSCNYSVKLCNESLL